MDNFNKNKKEFDIDKSFVIPIWKIYDFFKAKYYNYLQKKLINKMENNHITIEEYKIMSNELTERFL